MPGHIDGNRVERIDAPHAEQPFHGHIGGDAEKGKYHDRFQIAATNAHQCAAAAATRQRHADAKHQTAANVGEPGDVRPCVKRF